MLETFFQRSFAIRRLRHGPLAGHIDLLADRLAAQGYSRVHSRIQLRHIGHFNRWLQQEHLSLEQLDENMIERYWRCFMREKRVRPKDVFALMKLLDLLREQGVTPRRAIARTPQNNGYKKDYPINGTPSKGKLITRTRHGSEVASVDLLLHRCRADAYVRTTWKTALGRPS